MPQKQKKLLGFMVESWAKATGSWTVESSEDGQGNVDSEQRIAVIPDSTTRARRAVRLHEALHAAVGHQHLAGNDFAPPLEELRIDALARSRGVDTSARLDEYQMSRPTPPTVPRDAAMMWLQLASSVYDPRSLKRGHPKVRKDCPDHLREYFDSIDGKLSPEQRAKLTATAEVVYKSPTESTRDLVAGQLDSLFALPEIMGGGAPMGMPNKNSQTKGGQNGSGKSQAGGGSSQQSAEADSKDQDKQQEQTESEQQDGQQQSGNSQSGQSGQQGADGSQQGEPGAGASPNQKDGQDRETQQPESESQQQQGADAGTQAEQQETGESDGNGRNQQQQSGDSGGNDQEQQQQQANGNSGGNGQEQQQQHANGNSGGNGQEQQQQQANGNSGGNDQEQHEQTMQSGAGDASQQPESQSTGGGDTSQQRNAGRTSQPQPQPATSGAGDDLESPELREPQNSPSSEPPSQPSQERRQAEADRKQSGPQEHKPASGDDAEKDLDGPAGTRQRESEPGTDESDAAGSGANQPEQNESEDAGTDRELGTESGTTDANDNDGTESGDDRSRGNDEKDSTETGSDQHEQSGEADSGGSAGTEDATGSPNESKGADGDNVAEDGSPEADDGAKERDGATGNEADVATEGDIDGEPAAAGDDSAPKDGTGTPEKTPRPKDNGGGLDHISNTEKTRAESDGENGEEAIDETGNGERGRDALDTDDPQPTEGVDDRDAGLDANQPQVGDTRRRVQPKGCISHTVVDEQFGEDGEWHNLTDPRTETPVLLQVDGEELSTGERPEGSFAVKRRASGGVGSNTTAIGKMEIEHQTDRHHRSKPLRRPGGAADTGQIPEVMERWAEDKQIFKSRRRGGALLIDCSGSMSWDWDVLREAMTEFPAMRIAAYNGSGSSGRLCVLAENGRWADFDRKRLPWNGNEVDLEALAWLCMQPGPRVWLSDGYICGGRVGRLGTGEASRQATRMARQKKIVRADSINSALAYLRIGGTRAVKGTMPANSGQFIPHDWAASDGKWL
jgi:hypothetical protein